MNRKLCVSAAGVMAIGVLAVAGCKMSSAGATERIAVEEPANYEVTCPAEKYSELLPVSDTQDIPQIIMSRDWGAEDAYLLEKIAMAEAEGEDTEGKALVMLVVLNRVWSDGLDVYKRQSGRRWPTPGWIRRLDSILRRLRICGRLELWGMRGLMTMRLHCGR